MMKVISSILGVMSLIANSESLQSVPNVNQDKLDVRNNVDILKQAFANEFATLHDRINKQDQKIAGIEESAKQQELLIKALNSEVSELKNIIQIQDKDMTKMAKRIEVIFMTTRINEKKMTKMAKINEEMDMAPRINEQKMTKMATQINDLEMDNATTERKGMPIFTKDSSVFLNDTVDMHLDTDSETVSSFEKHTDHSEHGQNRAARVASGHVAFSAYLDHNLYHLTTGHILKCNRPILNVGNHYNAHTGVFTVPSTGVYLLTFFINGFGNNHRTFVRLVVDDRNIVAAVSLGGTADEMGGNTAIVQLTAGEAVWLEIFGGTTTGQLQTDNNFRYVTFSGVLLF